MPLVQSNNTKFNIYLNDNNEIGYVERITHPICYASGLPGAMLNEVVIFESGEKGYVFALEDDYAKVVVFSTIPVEIGTKIARSGKVLSDLTR